VIAPHLDAHARRVRKVCTKRLYVKRLEASGSPRPATAAWLGTRKDD
jgi:hypothetical protein